MFSVDVRREVSRKMRSQSSTASHRSSTGVRFHRSQLRHTTHRRPLDSSKARRRPTGKVSMTSFVPSDFSQNMQVVYIGADRGDRWG